MSIDLPELMECLPELMECLPELMECLPELMEWSSEHLVGVSIKDFPEGG